MTLINIRLSRAPALSALLLMSLPSAAMAAAEVCSTPSAPLFAQGFKAIHTVRVVTGKDGESHFEDGDQSASSHPFFNTGKFVDINVLSNAAKVSLVSGPPNETIPMHPKPAPGVFLLLAGWNAVTTASGEERVIRPGTLLIFDDADSRSGHGGRTGPCGFVSLTLSAPEAPPTPPKP